MKVYLLYFLLLLFLISNVSAQSDTINITSDTIYLKGDPVIIKSVFYEPGTKVKDVAKWVFSGNVGFGKTHFSNRGNDTQFFTGNAFNVSVEAGKTFKNWIFGIGVGYISSPGTVEYNSKRKFESQVHKLILDTIDIYEEIVQGVQRKYYITEERDTLINTSEIRDSMLKDTYKSSFLLIPLRTVYTFKKQDWFLSGSFAACPGLSFYNQHSAIGDQLKQKKLILFGSLEAVVGRHITKQFCIAMNFQYYKNITQMFTVIKSPAVAMWMGGLKIYLFF